MRYFFFYIFFTFFYRALIAQDIQYSQYFNIPAYMNPALVGSGAPYWKGTFHTRIQWPKLEARVISNLLSFEKSFNDINSGIGGYVQYDSYSGGALSKITTSFQYAYTLDLSASLSLKTGISAGFIYYKKNTDLLIFPDQYDQNGLNGFESNEPFSNDYSISPDLGAGIMLYGDHFWIGVNASHINQPNVSFYNDSDLIYPVKYSVHLGGLINLSHTKYNRLYRDKIRKMIYPVLNYKLQDQHDQFEVGAYGLYNVVLLGLYYRGLPFKEYNEDLHNHESIIISAGYDYKNHIHIAYSYDLVVSHQFGHTGGAHEINITLSPIIVPKKMRKKKYDKRLPCPPFIQPEW